MRLLLIGFCLLWLGSACQTLHAPHQQQAIRSQMATLHATSAYDSATRVISLACILTNQGSKPLALLYEPTLRSAMPNMNWAVRITTAQGIHLTDCAAPIIKAHIPSARAYTVVQAGQQIGVTLTIQAPDLRLSENEECHTQKTAMLAGTYQVQVFYHDAHTRHQQAIADLQSLPMTLTLE